MRRRIKLPALEVTEPPEYEAADGQVCPGILQLAPPLGFSPALIRPDEKFDQIVMGLALACNDLHDCLWVLKLTGRGRPKVARLNGYDGGRMGLELWAMRVLSGILNELLDAIKKYRAVIEEHDETREIVGTMSQASVAAWNELLELAKSTRKQNGDRDFLADVRDNLSYHYYQPKRLARGYKRAFFEDPKEDRNRLAYLSYGRNAMQTRFYFIDAAAQTATDISNIEMTSSYQKELRLVKLAEAAASSAHAFVGGFVLVRIKRAQRGSSKMNSKGRA